MKKYYVLDTNILLQSPNAIFGFEDNTVVLGDINQIDVPFLDKTNSGLIYLAHKMKGSSKCAQITFTEKESVRSALAAEALARLDL